MQLWWLLVSHFTFDWGLQNRWMAENKSKYYEVLFAHCMIYTGGISICLNILNILKWWHIPFILIGHFIVDLISSKTYNVDDKYKYNLWIDHLIHFIQIGVIYINT